MIKRSPSVSTISQTKQSKFQQKITCTTSSNFYNMNQSNMSNPYQLKQSKNRSISFNVKRRNSKSITNNISNDMKSGNLRVPTETTYFTKQKPSHVTSTFKSTSSYAKETSAVNLRVESMKNITPYQQYKLKTKLKRKVFTSQMIPSKNKIMRLKSKIQSTDSQLTYSCNSPDSQTGPGSTMRTNEQTHSNKNFVEILGETDPEIKIKSQTNFNKVRSVNSSKPPLSKKAVKNRLNFMRNGPSN